MRTPEPEPCPVQYDIVMATIVNIYHQMHAKHRLRKWSPKAVAGFVIQAGDQLAGEIEQLPYHLKYNDNTLNEDQDQLERRLPWIATQRTSLVVVLLYYRLAVNRILQTYWLEGSTNFARAHSVCLSSAVGMFRSAQQREGASHCMFFRLRRVIAYHVCVAVHAGLRS
jgi:hypothetical protein